MSWRLVHDPDDVLQEGDQFLELGAPDGPEHYTGDGVDRDGHKGRWTPLTYTCFSVGQSAVLADPSAYGWLRRWHDDGIIGWAVLSGDATGMTTEANWQVMLVDKSDIAEWPQYELGTDWRGFLGRWVPVEEKGWLGYKVDQAGLDNGLIRKPIYAEAEPASEGDRLYDFFFGDRWSPGWR